MGTYWQFYKLYLLYRSNYNYGYENSLEILFMLIANTFQCKPTIKSTFYQKKTSIFIYNVENSTIIFLCDSKNSLKHVVLCYYELNGSFPLRPVSIPCIFYFKREITISGVMRWHLSCYTVTIEQSYS